MPVSSFHAPTTRAFTGYSPAFTDGIGLPTGRRMANGSQAALIVGLGAHVNGNGAVRPVALQLGNAVTAWFNVPPASTGTWTGRKGTSQWLVQGGTARMHIHMQGLAYFLRGGGGRTTDAAGTGWDGGIAGEYEWWEAPTPPEWISAVSDPNVSGRIQLRWGGSASDGGTGINGFRIFEANGRLVANVPAGRYDWNVDGLPVGRRYSFVVRARNAVTDAAGTESENSPVGTAYAPGNPSPPRDMRGVPDDTTPRKVNLSWTVPEWGQPMTGYNVYNNTTGQLLGQVAGNVTTFSTTDTAPGVLSAYYVRGKNAFSDRNGQTGTESSFVTVRAPGNPNTPTNFKAEGDPLVSGRLNLSWSRPQPQDNPVNQITYYGIFTSDGTQLALVQAWGGDTTAVSVDNLTPGQNYTLHVKARNAFGNRNGTWSAASNAYTAMVPGLPSEPRNLSAVASTSVFGQVSLTWASPLDAAGGITRYNIYANGVQIGTSTTTSFTAEGLTTARSYEFTVRARNLFADTNGSAGPASSPAVATAPGAPSAPRNLSAIASESTAGAVVLSWTEPETTSGTITGYSVYYSTGELIATLSGTGTSYTVSGQVPGTTYSFYVKARNAIADVVGTFSAPSNTATTRALGQPDAPTGLSVTPSATVAGRLTLSWAAPSGSVTGYNVYAALSNTSYLLIGRTKNTNFVVDFLTPGDTYTYFVRARNAVTDAAGNDGPNSASASGTPGATSVQTVTATPVTNQTNTQLNGTYSITDLTATSVSYLRLSGSNVPYSVVPVGVSTLLNNTNTNLNGTYAITVPSANSFSYAKTGTAIAAGTATSGGLTTNNTNIILNGTYSVTAANPSTRRVSYARTGSNISARVGGGKITNTTNTIYNKNNATILSVTADTIKYSIINADIAETAATGAVFNNTNTDVFNGTYTVTGTPEHNIFSYVPSVTGSYTPINSTILEPYGQAARVDSRSSLLIRYRSGWLG